MPIDAIARLGSITAPTASISKSTGLKAQSLEPKAQSPESHSFGESLMNLVNSVESSGANANQAVSNMLDKSGDVHDAMIALQRAEMTLQLTVQIRNKLVSAYQDIMRMPV